MELRDLNHEERLALVALLELVLESDRAVSDGEVAEHRPGGRRARPRGIPAARHGGRPALPDRGRAEGVPALDHAPGRARAHLRHRPRHRHRGCRRCSGIGRSSTGSRRSGRCTSRCRADPTRSDVGDGPFDRSVPAGHDGRFHARTPRRRPQHRHHRPRRPRQDHAGRRHAAPDAASSAPTSRWPSASWTRTTSSASAASPSWRRTRPSRWEGVQINIVDTPGPRRLRRRGRAHARHGRRRPAAGRRLRGPAAADPLRAREGARARASRRSSASTRSTAPTRAPAEVLDEVYGLFIDLGANEQQLDFPVVYTNARAGTATRELDDAGDRPAAALRRASSARSPARRIEPDAPTQFQVNNLDYDDYVGRLAIGRIVARRAASRRAVHALPRRRHAGRRARSRSSTAGTASSASSSTRADAGDIVAVAGIEEIDIGDTIADREQPAAAAAASASTSRPSP